MDWKKTVFLHTGWAAKYDGTEVPRGGHAYLQNEIGVEAENFKNAAGWCYGYAPVSRAGAVRGLNPIPKGSRTLDIRKLGAIGRQSEIDGITVVWTAKKPNSGPVVVGVYRNATIYRLMPPDSAEVRPFIAKARAGDCHLVPLTQRKFAVPHKQKGFPGMAAAWFPGEHLHGTAQDFLAQADSYLSTLC